jgi:hypothetical protein
MHRPVTQRATMTTSATHPTMADTDQLDGAALLAEIDAAAVADVVAKFQAMRDALSNEQWDALCDLEPVDALLTSLMELEACSE